MVVLTNAAGGIRPDLVPGTLMAIDDHINMMGVNPLLGPHDDFWGPRFADQSCVYDAALREVLDRAASTLILVELKHGRLEPAHREQLRRYLDHARESSLLRRHLDRGCALRGVLASLDPGKLALRYDDITVRKVDAARVIPILARLRRRALRRR